MTNIWERGYSMNLREFFTEVGGDYESVLLRLPSSSMVKRFVYKFVDDPSYEELKSAWKQSDIPTAFRAAHTLKGIAVNLGLDNLGEAASQLTEQLRNTSVLPSAEYMEAVDRSYQMTVAKIRQIED